MTVGELKSFCSVDKTRQNIMEPFAIADRVYATDGRIIVSVPDRLKFFSPSQITGVEGIMEADFEPVPREFPKDVPPTKGPSPCHHCLPEAKGRCNCPPCQRDMDGTGECRFCDDGLEQENPEAVKFGKQIVSHILLNQIKDLPGLRLHESPDPMGPLFFSFDGGGLGRLMPLRPDR